MEVHVHYFPEVRHLWLEQKIHVLSGDMSLPSPLKEVQIHFLIQISFLILIQHHSAGALTHVTVSDYRPECKSIGSHVLSSSEYQSLPFCNVSSN